MINPTLFVSKIAPLKNQKIYILENNKVIDHINEKISSHSQITESIIISVDGSSINKKASYGIVVIQQIFQY